MRESQAGWERGITLVDMKNRYLAQILQEKIEPPFVDTILRVLIVMIDAFIQSTMKASARIRQSDGDLPPLNSIG